MELHRPPARHAVTNRHYFFAGPKQDLRGRTVVVTGASSGIGAAAAGRFAERGATVAVVGRSPDRTASVAAAIGGKAYLADYGSLDEVRGLARALRDHYPRIDVLANNAGGMFATRRTSADGNEMTFQVNHLAPFLLTSLLLDRLAEAPEGARVVNTASMVYRFGRLDLDDLDGAHRRYRSQRAYGAAKLATIMFTSELARRTQGTGVTAAAFHPGSIASDLSRDGGATRLIVGSRLAKAVLSTPDKGAEPLLHLATQSDPQSTNGHYFHRLKHEEPKNKQATDPDLDRRLWEVSAHLTGVTAN
jgi:NAD(P)-dependent dehydrogenase (short-subunit alcohol dehydrogenase family)